MSDPILGIGSNALVPFPKENTDKELYDFLNRFVRSADENIDFLLRPTLRSVSANYTAVDSDYTILVDATGGARTITLPIASKAKNKVYNIKKIDSSTNNVTVDGNGSETIDGATTYVIINQYESIMIHSDGTAWFII